MHTLSESCVRLVASSRSWIEGEATRQLYATASLDGMIHTVGFPDLHPGNGTPVGAAFVTDDVTYPHLIGGDIGCGMAFHATDLVRRDLKLDRWSSLPFELEHPWDGAVAEYLKESSLSSTEFDDSMGTLSGGNHFAELQCVEEVVDAAAFQSIGLGNQQLAVLVHSGSRGLGQTVLRSHVDEHAGRPVEADSFAGAEYLHGHDHAVCWAAANRRLIARRFVEAIGAEAEPLWDGCHNSLARQHTDEGTVWIHRKGAVEADSPFVVIPGSRGSLSYVVKPIGDGISHAWSLAHGAGRKWTRSDARARMR
jgi:release factor H-coupled RctB family protein